MVRVLLTLIASMTCIGGFSQCTYTWEKVVVSPEGADSVTWVINEKLVSSGFIQGVDSLVIPKRFLDSAIGYFEQRGPQWFLEEMFRRSQRQTDSTRRAIADSFRIWYPKGYDRKIFVFNGKQVHHLWKRKYLAGTDSIEVHKFAYCKENDWDVDAPQCEFLYTKRFGIIEKIQTNGMVGIPVIAYYLKGNNCLSESEGTKMRALVISLGQRGIWNTDE